ncbi:restriction endonuclease subunit S [Lactobacillus delbrueckii]|uniref:restriction endonuclease subunit S n=1 Tax=Lactobacillus delbrueckii TaxID=1584 RepID=UPI0004AC393D|nr:restriction endonuclease subunit S [Lactobacillus delbrueckii]CDR80400.1 Putative uncharacterized protein [Lactobacillus delbrueckii subsp. lactis]
MKYKLSEIGKIVGGGTPSSKHEEYYTPNGIPWLTPKDLSNYTNMYISRGARDITEEGLKKSSAKLLPAKSILVSSRAPIGYVAIANNSITTNQGFKSIVPNTEVVIPEYLYFVMKKSKAALEQVSSGSTFKEVSTKVMANFEVDIPSIEVQRKILTYLMPISQKIELNKRINDNLVQQLSVGFEKLYSDSRHTKTFCLNEILDSTLTGEWGKEKASNPFNHKSVIIRGTDFDEISNGCVGSAPTRYLKASSFDKKFLKSNDVLVEISGGSPTQSTGRSILITNKMLEHFDVRVFGTNFTRTFRLNGPEEAIIFKSYIDFLYRKNVFFNYENGTTGIKNLDYKAVLKMVLPDVRQAPTFKQYLMLYTKYYSLVQQLGSESMRLNDAKENLLNRYF